ncbi:hypothetical protein GCM10022630_19760 [Thermobifida alba]
MLVSTLREARGLWEAGLPGLWTTPAIPAEEPVDHGPAPPVPGARERRRKGDGPRQGGRAGAV